jgi:hypothetical protein
MSKIKIYLIIFSIYGLQTLVLSEQVIEITNSEKQKIKLFIKCFEKIQAINFNAKMPKNEIIAQVLFLHDELLHFFNENPDVDDKSISILSYLFQKKVENAIIHFRLK